MVLVNNIFYSYLCFYFVINGMVISLNGIYMNGYIDNIIVIFVCCSLIGMYIFYLLIYFNCVMFISGIGGGSVSYYLLVSTNVRMRMFLYLF